MGKSLESLFGVSMGEGTSVNQAVMTAGLIVAGEPDAVTSTDGDSAGAKMAEGIQRVTAKGNKAVQKARTMNQGIGKELSVHRTMVFKR